MPASRTLTRKLIDDHLVDGAPQPGREIGLKIDQTLTQDATGTVVMLELEAMGLDRAQTELSVQYVDHNLLQTDERNAQDHDYLRTFAARHGIWYSPPGNGVSHPVHQQHFGVPGKTLLGSDSHTPAAGAIGMLAIGAGGIDVARAIAGFPFYVDMPRVWGIELVGELQPWVSAKDVILELLRRHGVDGGLGCVLEYHGPGLRSLSAMDRHVIANMGTELGATSSVFPSDDEVRRFLGSRGRADAWRPLAADAGAEYDRHERLDLGEIVPMIAMPSSPGNVHRVEEVAGRPIRQAYIGSSANPGFRDFAIAAEIVGGKHVPADVSLDINPTSRDLLAALSHSGHLEMLISAGARLHQAGCNGCIGMGQAPATEQLSLRTVPRNFPGRSGAREDAVCLVSPETAAASALRGRITDPRTLSPDVPYPRIDPPRRRIHQLEVAKPPANGSDVEVLRGPNIVPLPTFEPLPDQLALPVELVLGDDVSTDEIMPAGAKVLPLRSNIPAISEHVFDPIDTDYAARTRAAARDGKGHAIVAGRNYGQGSSREHAALAPRFLGLRVVLAVSYARIHHANLVSHGILPLRIDAREHARCERGDLLRLEGLRTALTQSNTVRVTVASSDRVFEATHALSQRQIGLVLSGGAIADAASRDSE